MPSGQFKTSYRDDIRIFQTLWVKFWLGILAIILIVFPFFAGQYFLYIANVVGIAIIGALGLNILSGVYWFDFIRTFRVFGHWRLLIYAAFLEAGLTLLGIVPSGRNNNCPERSDHCFALSETSRIIFGYRYLCLLLYR